MHWGEVSYTKDDAAAALTAAYNAFAVLQAMDKERAGAMERFFTEDASLRRDG